jgi:isoleucyl-tRNA synthetase
METPGQLDHKNLVTGDGFRPASERSELDRWMLAELHATATTMVDALDNYDHYVAARALSDLVDAVSNWFVRRSRDRFWASGKADASADGNPEKCDAYWTLYEVLTTTARLAAPFVPFVSEAFWQNLAVGPFGSRVSESIHLTDYPTANTELINPDLARQMALIREVASLGRAARAQAKLKVRQPLSKVEVILAEPHKNDANWLVSHADLVCNELNFRAFEICAEPERYITRTILPDLKKLGPRLGKKLPLVRNALQQADATTLMTAFHDHGVATVSLADGTDVSIREEDCIIRTTARDGWAAAEGTRGVVIISSELTPELLAEGHVREVIHAVQSQRKTLDLEFTDRIELGFDTDSEELQKALQAYAETLASETLAVSISFELLQNAELETLDVDGRALTMSLKRARPPETS